MIPRMDQERWKPITEPEFEDLYEVSDQGRIRSLPRPTPRGVQGGRVLKPARLGPGYQTVTLSGNGLRVHRLVHQLVLRSFVGEPEEGQEVRHLNGVRGDNRLENLDWGTSSENEADKRRHGTLQAGEKNGAAKLSAAQVAEIRRTYASGGVSQKTLAAAYRVSQGTVSRLITGTRWAHLNP